MWESHSDFQGRWKGWETCIWFSSFPRTVISTASRSSWFESDAMRSRTGQASDFAVDGRVQSAVSNKPFTAKQGQYLAFIFCYMKIHGVAPAESDMQKYFKVTPPSVHQMVLTLEANGFMERIPGRNRSIRLLITRQELPDLE
jgi:hypothetical protein